jgi:Ser/Thr protein kinase RdoA (MazF antagonist)
MDTPLAFEVIRQIVTAYALPEAQVMERVSRGYLTTNYLVQAGDSRYFLKRWRQTDGEKIAEIGVVEQFFSSRDLPVVTPLLTVLGNTYTETMDGIYSVYPYIPPRHVDRKDLRSPHIASLARTQARLHTVGQGVDREIRDHYKPWNREKFFTVAAQIEEIIRSLPQHTPFDRLALTQIALKRSLLAREERQLSDFPLTYDTLCHGDWTNDNVFFTEDGKVSHIFDWEKAEKAPRVVELARAIDYICLDGQFTAQTIRAAVRYVSEYSAAIPLEAAELRAGLTARYIKEMHSIWVLEEHYLNQSGRVDVFLPRSVASLRYWSTHFAELEAALVAGLREPC